MEALWQRLDHGLRAAMPGGTGLALALLSVAVWPLPWLGPVMPPLAFIALYYWVTHRPDLFPVWVAFMIGLLTDILNGLPMGVSAFLFTVAHQIVLRQRRLLGGHSFWKLWAGFALAAVALMIAEWILVALVRWQIAPFFPAFVQTILAIVVFPLPCWIMIRLQRAALSQG